jgi:hypothetical protein
MGEVPPQEAEGGFPVPHAGKTDSVICFSAIHSSKSTPPPQTEKKPMDLFFGNSFPEKHLNGASRRCTAAGGTFFRPTQRGNQRSVSALTFFRPTQRGNQRSVSTLTFFRPLNAETSAAFPR